MPIRSILAALGCMLLALATASGQGVAPTAEVPGGAPRTILFLGDSLTFGYGLENPQTEAYPSLIREKIRAAGLHYQVINAGVSGATTADGLASIKWRLPHQAIDILFLALGGNDGLRGLSLDDSRANLQKIIDAAKARYPDVRVVIAGMRMPPNFGAEYNAKFQEAYADLAKANPGSTLLPFLLEGVGGIEGLNQGDQIHPNAEGHRKIAELVWGVLEPLCRARP